MPLFLWQRSLLPPFSCICVVAFVFLFMSIILQLLIHTWWNFAKRTHALKLSCSFQEGFHWAHLSRICVYLWNSEYFLVVPIRDVLIELLLLLFFYVSHMLIIVHTNKSIHTQIHTHTQLKSTLDLNWGLSWTTISHSQSVSVRPYQLLCTAWQLTHSLTRIHTNEICMVTWVEWVCAWSIWIRAWKHLF